MNPQSNDVIIGKDITAGWFNHSRSVNLPTLKFVIDIKNDEVVDSLRRVFVIVRGYNG